MTPPHPALTPPLNTARAKIATPKRATPEKPAIRKALREMTPSTGLRNKPIRFAVSDRGTWNEHSGREARIFIPISGASYSGFAACFHTQSITNKVLTFGLILKLFPLILGLCRLLLIRFGFLFAEPFRGIIFGGPVSWGALFGSLFRDIPFWGSIIGEAIFRGGAFGGSLFGGARSGACRENATDGG